MLNSYLFNGLSNRTKKAFGLALLITGISGVLDVSLALKLSKVSFGDLGALELILFVLRLAFYMLGNFAILTFSMNAELDFKKHSLNFSQEEDATIVFNNYSQTSSHMYLTGILRLISESMIGIFLISTLLIIEPESFTFLAICGSTLLPLAYFYLRFAKKSRVLATSEQSYFLSFGRSVIDCLESIQENDSKHYMRNMLLEKSYQYRKATRNSLFLSQSMKPLFELMGIVLLVSYVFFFGELGFSTGYLFFRLASVTLVFANTIPLVLHYFHNYLFVRRGLNEK